VILFRSKGLHLIVPKSLFVVIVIIAAILLVAQ